jgi:hypothetical protein
MNKTGRLINPILSEFLTVLFFSTHLSECRNFKKTSGIKNSITDNFRKELCADLQDVRKGPSEELTRKTKQYGSPPELILSLRFRSKVIDLELETEAERDSWYQCFSWLRDFARDSQVSGPLNVKHVAHVDVEFKWSGNDFEDQIELKKKIGEGAFGEVFYGVHKTTHLEFAIKMVMCSDCLCFSHNSVA